MNTFTKTKNYCNLKLQNAILIKLFGGSILKQKKVFSSVMLGATLLLLTSCGQQSASATKSADKATSTQVTQKKSSVSAKKAASSSQVSSSTQSATSSRASVVASSSSQAAASSRTTAAVDDKAVGLMLWMQKASIDYSSDVLQDYASNGMLYYSPSYSSNFSSEINGYQVVHTHGDGSGDVYYKINGDTVTYKGLVITTDVAHGKLETNTMPIADLVAKYDSTAADQAQLKTYVSELQPETE